MKNLRELFTIEHFDIMDSGSQEIEVKCSKCGKKSHFPFVTLIRRENGASCATYREFCSNSCFIDWVIYMSPKFKELKDNIPVREDSKNKSEILPDEDSIESEESD